jgi:hypothetical protein
MVPPTVNLVAIWVKGRVETARLEVVAKDVPDTACANLIYVLTSRIARIFSNLEVMSGLISTRIKDGSLKILTNSSIRLGWSSKELIVPLNPGSRLLNFSNASMFLIRKLRCRTVSLISSL